MQPNFFIHSPADSNQAYSMSLDWDQLNMNRQVSLWEAYLASLSYISRSQVQLDHVTVLFFRGFNFLFENNPYWIPEQLHQFLFSFPKYKISVSMHPYMSFLDDDRSDWSDIESQRAYNPLDHLLSVSYRSEISRCLFLCACFFCLS